MRMYDIIQKKRDGFELTKEEIEFFIDGYTKGDIPDYQASALAMAIYFKGMNSREVTQLTLAMANSGDTLDLSAIDGITVDKHSTGGVGDKTTLIVAPIVASLGCKIAKMSGRGLGHTGGTVDKLESVNVKIELSPSEFISQVQEIGISVIGQSGNLAPADKKLYALRDVTATVSSIPLIASSIMSKKLAAGSECIVLDVKTGSGAFMKTPKEAQKLAECMVEIGKNAGRKMAALITDMDIPLGTHIGNTLEVTEAVSVLKGETDNDLKQVCVALASNIVSLAKNITENEAEALVIDAIESGKAYKKFREFITAQGGDISYCDEPEKYMPKAKIKHEVISAVEGYIYHTDTEMIGVSSVILGAGREKKDDKIDYTAGIILKKKTGDFVKKGEILAEFYTNSKGSLAQAENIYLSAVTFIDTKPKKIPLIYKTIR